MTTDQKVNLKYILVQCTYQMVAGVVYGYGLYMLMSRGFSSGTAGLCMSIACVSNALIQPVISNFLDTTKKITVFGMAAICSFIVLLATIINSCIDHACLLLGLVFILFNATYSAYEPVINSFDAKLQEKGIRSSFATARAFGSFGYGLACIVLGALTENNPYTIVLYGAIFFALINFISILLIRKEYQNLEGNTEIKKEVQENIGFGEFIKRNKNYMCICICLVGIFFAYTSIDNFMLLVVSDVGGSSSDMGKILAFKAALETITIFIFPKIIKKFRLERVLMVAGICFCLKSLSYCLVKNVLTVYLSELFQIMSFSFIFPGMVEYVNQNMNNNEVIRGQAFFTMTIAIAASLSGVIAGNLIELFSVGHMKQVAFIVSAISSLGFCFFMNRKDIKE